jgi:hypothetical protein
MAKRTYVALTTADSASGWHIVAISRSMREAEALARARIGSMIDSRGIVDIYAQTEHLNLRVMPLQIAVKLGYTSYNDVVEFYEREFMAALGNSEN